MTTTRILFAFVLVLLFPSVAFASEAAVAALSHPVTRLGMGVLVALAVYLYRKASNKELDLQAEVKTLVVPVASVAGLALYSGASWSEAGMTALTALAVAVGLNTNRAPVDAPPPTKPSTR